MTQEPPHKKVRVAEEVAEKPIIRVGGVPEHFNYPWQMAIDRCIFEKHGVEVEWHVIKEGTGAMISALKGGKVDVIVALSEGLVSDIAKGSDLRLLGTYVESPLCWAVSVGAKSKFKEVAELKNETFAISRFTSGSHLMTNVMASQRGWDVPKLKFEVTGNFTNLRNAVNDPNNPCSAFMWETFTTKPFHDSGEIRRIGDVTTPWPCFMMCTRESFAQDNSDTLKKMATGIREACGIFTDNSDIIPLQIAKRFGLKKEDALKWYQGVNITASPEISETAITRALSALRETGVVPEQKNGVCDDLDAYLCAGHAVLKKDIAMMPLYRQSSFARYLHKELDAKEIGSGPISYRDTLTYDIKHYHGVKSVQTCIDTLNLSSGSRVINFGSGLGGCARYIAGTVGCEVLAIDLQLDVHGTASELTARCEDSIKERVHHIGADFLKVGRHLARNSYDCITSWLTILHIVEREELFKLCFDLLKQGGQLYMDDFVKLSDFTKEEQKFLCEKIHCKRCPTPTEYVQHLVDAGFEVTLKQDLTGDWVKYTGERSEQFDKSLAETTAIHGEEDVEALSGFYRGVAELFENGNLGGIRLMATKP